MLESLNKKQKTIFFSIISIMIAFIIYYSYKKIYTNNNLTNSYYPNSIYEDNFIISSTTLNEEENNENYIIVYICGAVKENKVIKLQSNSRVADAIDLAGGLLDNADLSDINLAYILEDGEKIYIPKIGENNIETTNTESTSSSNKSKKININKATQTELEEIPGIGPSLALKIIDHRESNGKFSKIEDIKNVSGIGDSKYENIKNYISVK